jgi:hypothetical protein
MKLIDWQLEGYEETDHSCLYCKSTQCDVNVLSLSSPVTLTHIDVVTCQICKEYYKVVVLEPAEDSNFKKTMVYVIEMSCGSVIVSPGKHGFYIGALGSIIERRTQVPYFDFDLSDRKKLEEKLRTYLIFS